MSRSVLRIAGLATALRHFTRFTVRSRTKAIHRDIKPSNIIRDRHGKLYLLDFGAVKQVTSQAGGAQSASTGIYSMGFAPPEQVSGGEVYPSTDLYALAVTAVNLLTGKNLQIYMMPVAINGIGECMLKLAVSLPAF
nr:protein kinase [Chroococcidiopsis cubana]